MRNGSLEKIGSETLQLLKFLIPLRKPKDRLEALLIAVLVSLTFGTLTAQIPKWNWAFKSGGNRDESIIKPFSDKEGNSYFLLNSQSNPIFLGNTSTPANPPVNGNVNTTILQKIKLPIAHRIISLNTKLGSIFKKLSHR
jgi:hypothetical protein